MSRLLLVTALALTAAGCERLNADWCKKPGRCPAGTTCDPVTNTCLGTPKDARGDSPVVVDRKTTEPVLPPDLKVDAPILCKGGFICAAGAVATCLEAGASLVKRRCPIDGCLDGHCLIPEGAKTCATNLVCPKLPQQWVCTWLLDKGTTPKQVCAQSVPGSELATACTSGTDCATGLCTVEGRCYHACNDDLECTPLHCVDSGVDIEGVSKTVKSCN
jgi:hypothetical protein